MFTQLCEQLAGDLSRKGYAGKTIGIKLRFDDFKSVTARSDAADSHDGCARDSTGRRRVSETGRPDAADCACSGCAPVPRDVGRAGAHRCLRCPTARTSRSTARRLRARSLPLFGAVIGDA